MEDKKTKRVVIDIYDEDGVLVEVAEGTYSYDELLGELKEIIANEGVPVVRDLERMRLINALQNVPKDEDDRGQFPEPHPVNIMPNLTLRWKVNGVEFEAYGPVEDVKYQETLFRSQLADIIATTVKQAEGNLDRLDEMIKEELKQ